MAPEQKSKSRLPAFPDAPPIGFALEGRQAELYGTMLVPAELLQAIGAYVKQVQAAKSAPSP